MPIVRSPVKLGEDPKTETSAEKHVIGNVLAGTSEDSPNVELERCSSAAGSGEEEQSDNSEQQGFYSGSKLSDLTNGEVTQARKDDEFGIIDNVYYRLFYLRHFRFDDITIQIDENVLLIEAKHKTYTDEHGFSTRTFIRKHYLPDYVMGEKLTSYFTGDGVLVIQAPCAKRKCR